MPPAHFVDLCARFPQLAIDLRYRRSANVTGAPLPGYGTAEVWLHERVAERLSAAVQALQRAGYGLIVYDAYRPLRAARALAQWARDTDQAWLLDGYIAETSRHSRGTAIDLGLLRDGDVVPMGTDFDAFGPDGHTLNASGAALDNRLRLRDAMLAAGLEDYRREWWHFDLPALDAPEQGCPFLDLPYPSTDGA